MATIGQLSGLDNNVARGDEQPMCIHLDLDYKLEHNSSTILKKQPPWTSKIRNHPMPLDRALVFHHRVEQRA